MKSLIILPILLIGGIFTNEAPRKAEFKKQNYCKKITKSPKLIIDQISVVVVDGKPFLKSIKSNGIIEYKQQIDADNGCNLSIIKFKGKYVINLTLSSDQNKEILQKPKLAYNSIASTQGDVYYIYPSRYANDGTAIEMCNIDYNNFHMCDVEGQLQVHLVNQHSETQMWGDPIIVTTGGSGSANNWYLNCWISNDPSVTVEKH